ncbi:T9SS type A sorting domain-containing protein [Chryseolinea sp. H1M3-3]|uniref:T9SS type A sorting domain-containing protein n=1 Tax=Chryseolinea sp. H1M3-3 TaxID=3034144 RepID=UPI0023EC278E|nr:T9SS type A sorting domain-containing protein [Chryseolinea sp. H1M3-3]
MKALYFTLILAFTIGSVSAQNPANYDFGQPERLDIGKSVQIYPNPAPDDFIHVRVEHVNLSEAKVSLHNIIGNEMRVEKDLLDENTLRIKVKDLATGYYLISLNDDKQKLKGIYKFLKL